MDELVAAQQMMLDTIFADQSQEEELGAPDEVGCVVGETRTPDLYRAGCLSNQQHWRDGQHGQDNPHTYLGGGRNFGPLIPGSAPFISRNLTPD
jgi:hypothetical protein